MTRTRNARKSLVPMVVLRILCFFLLMAALLFLPAGTLAYGEAWGFLAVMFVSMTTYAAYLLKTSPELLERRMRSREKETRQRALVKIMALCVFLTFLVPGFDQRFRWSDVPAGVVILADLLVFLGYGTIFLVLRENRYASAVVEVEAGQDVIRTGPYRVVRHPMYVGAALMFLSAPLALGSYWGIIPALMIVPLLAARIQNEEKVLQRDLIGYPDYMQQTRYRLIPGIW